MKAQIFHGDGVCIGIVCSCFFRITINRFMVSKYEQQIFPCQYSTPDQVYQTVSLINFSFICVDPVIHVTVVRICYWRNCSLDNFTFTNYMLVLYNKNYLTILVLAIELSDYSGTCNWTIWLFWYLQLKYLTILVLAIELSDYSGTCYWTIWLF